MGDKLTLGTAAILAISALSLFWWGVSYARRIYNDPMIRSWISVFRGVCLPLEVATFLTWGLLWYWGYFWELGGIVFIFWGAIGIPAIPMISLQEKKHREQLNG